jgi:DNA polymerase-3 subunit gamma/tau
MLFVAVGANEALEDAGSIEDSNLLREQARRFTPAALLSGLDMLAEAEREIRFSNQHRLLLEMALLKLMALPGGGAPAAPVTTMSPPLLKPMKRQEAPSNGAMAKKEAPATPAPPPAVAARPSSASEPDLSEEVADEGEELLDAVPEPRDEVPGDDLNKLLDQPEGLDEGQEIATLRRKWQEVIHHMQVRSPLGAQLIKDASLVSQDGRIFTLAFTQKMNLDMMENPKRRAFVEEIINKTVGAQAGTFRVKAVLAGSAPASEKPKTARASGAPAPTAPAQASLPEPAEKSSELLDEVIAVFGGKIIEEEA